MASRVTYTEEVDKCIKCGTCTNNCPVVLYAGSDIFPGPKYSSESLRVSHELNNVRDIIYFCTGCEKCDEVCPANVKTPLIMKIIRSHVFDETKLVEGHQKMVKNIITYDRAVEPYDEAKKKEMIGESVPVKSKEANILYFPGCISEERLFFIKEATKQILNNTETDYVIPENWGCCGSPVSKIGGKEIQENLAKDNKRLFENFEIIVTSCAGCVSNLKELFPDLRIYHTLEYLDEEIGIENLRFKKTNGEKVTVTMHYPCHLYRSLGRHVIDYAEEILERMPNVKYVKMRDADVCCGAGGGVFAGAPQIAEILALEKIQNVKKTGAALLVTPCPFCFLNLKLRSKETDIVVYEFIHFLADFIEPL